MNQAIPNTEILITLENGIGHIVLNRPRALNALSLEMIRMIAATLKAWEKDDAVRAVLFSSAGDRAFCSGGDIKSFYHAGMDYRRGQVDHKIPAVFFSEEYKLNQQIFHYPKPTIAYMDGITMGGGYGIAGHCKIRIATPKTVFAMPEVAIGFFPDVGAVYHLLKAPHHFGRYLALTGRHITAGDMLAAGLADVYMDSGLEGDVLNALQENDCIDAALKHYVKPLPDAEVYEKFAKDIERVFELWSLADIFEQLRKTKGGFSEETFSFFAKASPLSVCVTLEHLKRCEGQDFDTVIAADFLLAQRFIMYPDLYEGVRATLITKDRRPIWEPPLFNAVRQDEIARYFEPTDYALEDVKIFVV